MVSFSIRPSGGGPLATARAGSALGLTLPTLRKYGIAASYRKVGAVLPYDAEVEYLEVTGTQQIDTGVIPAIQDSYFLDIMSTATSPHVGIWSSQRDLWDSVPNKWFFIKMRHTTAQVQVWSFCPSSPTYQAITQSSDNIVNNRRSSVIVSLKDKYASFTNDAVANRINIRVGEPAPDQPSIKLVTGEWTGRIYGWRITRGDATIQECVPVRFTNELGQSEGAMYDKRGVGGMNPDGSARNDGLYRNQGTGAFSCGYDVAVVPSSETVQCVVPGEWSISTPSFTDRRFMGWFTAHNDPFDESGVPPAGALEIVNGSAMDLPLPGTVYACWQHKATVTFDPNLQGASVYMVPELYVGDPLTNVTSAYVIAPSESGASQVGWSANVVHAPSRRLIDVDPDSVQGGIGYNTQGAVASGDVYYALLLLPARVALDLNASSVDSSFAPSLDGTPGDYHEDTPYYYIPEAHDQMRDDVRFAFWTRDAHPAASYDPWQSTVTQIDLSMDMPTDGETLYAVWQNAVPVRFLGCADLIVYVFEGENLPDQLPEPDPGYEPQGAAFDGWEDAYQMKDVYAGDPVYSSYIGNYLSYPDSWTLTPKWAYEVSVTFDASTNGGSMPSGWVPPAYYSGRPYGTLPTPTHPTLSFAGWYDGGTLVTTSSIVPAGGANLVAEYSAQSYIVDLNGEWRRSGDSRTGDVDEFDEGYETQYPPDPSYDGVYESFANWHVADEVNYYDCPVARMYIDVSGYTEFTVYIRSYGESYYDFCVAMEPDVDLQDAYDPNIDWTDGTHYDNPWYYIQADTQSLVPDGVDVWSGTPPFGVSDGAKAAGIKATTIGWQTDGTNGLSDYMPVTYQLDGGSHRICVVYKKDPSYDESADRGYVIIPTGGQLL